MTDPGQGSAAPQGGETPPQQASQQGGGETVITPSGKGGQFTQEDLNKAAGNARREEREKAQREAQQARDEALRSLAGELGVTDTEQIKQIVQQQREAEEAQLGELQKLQKNHEKVTKERDELQSKVSELGEQITAMQLSQALQVGLIEAGINPERVTAAARLVDTEGLAVQEDGTVKGVEQAIEAAKKLAPELFNVPPQDIGTGGGTPPSDPTETKSDFSTMPKEEFEAMRRRARYERIPLRT